MFAGLRASESRSILGNHIGGSVSRTKINPTARFQRIKFFNEIQQRVFHNNAGWWTRIKYSVSGVKFLTEQELLNAPCYLSSSISSSLQNKEFNKTYEHLVDLREVMQKINQGKNIIEPLSHDGLYPYLTHEQIAAHIETINTMANQILRSPCSHSSEIFDYTLKMIGKTNSPTFRVISEIRIELSFK